MTFIINCIFAVIDMANYKFEALIVTFLSLFVSKKKNIILKFILKTLKCEIFAKI